MTDSFKLRYDIKDGDFAAAGNASLNIKRQLKAHGVDPEDVRRAAVAIYEGEINMVIHAEGGEITVEVDDDAITMVLADRGPGIPDVSQAMTAGFSTATENARNRGFGAGMGLPNMKKYTDELTVESVPGTGTTVTMKIYRKPH